MRPRPRRELSNAVFGTVVALLLVSGGLTVATPVAGLQAPDGGVGASKTVAATTGVDRPVGDATVGATAAVGRPGHPAQRTAPARRPGNASKAPNVSYTYRRLPERAGIVEVVMRVPATPAVEGGSVAFREEVTVVGTTDVERVGGTYRWDGEDPAEIVYRVPINWTYVGNRADSWTLVEHRSPSIDLAGSADRRETVEVAGEGYVGNGTVLLGAHDTYERRVEGGRIVVVVPEGVELRHGARRTADELADAARSLSIGGRDEVVHAVVTPQIEIEEATQFTQPGFALDGNTLLVDADSEFDVWTHEYVHTRQAWVESERLRWLTEGSAEYYGWLLSIEQGYDEWGSLRGVFSLGASDDSVLADPDTWGGETEYNKGALVLGVLDRAIRRASDGERTLEDVLRRLNRNGSDPTLETFLRVVRDVGGPDVAAAARRYVTTNATLTYRPDSARLDSVYGVGESNATNASPEMRTEVLDLSATGADRTRSLDPDRERVRVGANETLRLRAEVTNAGEAGGVATLVVRRSANGTDADRVATPWVGWVRPGDTVEVTGTVRFDRPGTYELVWGDRQYEVTVTEEPPSGTWPAVPGGRVLGVLGVLVLLGVVAGVLRASDRV